MAQNLQQIKKRIKTSKNIFQIAKAMEMIAASKIRKAQIAVERYNPFADRIMKIVNKILDDKDFSEDIEKFAKKRAGKKMVFIISPDKGLCGGLVVNLLKKASSCIEPEDYVVSIGKKASGGALKAGYNILASFNAGTSFPKYEDIFPMINIASKFYNSGDITSVLIVYSEFKNKLVQTASIREVLPIQRDENYIDNGIDYIMEPSGRQVLADLIPYYLEVEFYNAFMNSYASEQAARMAAMRNAKDNADEISASLTNIYNRSRQEKITNEILDLANGQQGI
ncbi:MAG: ATP synthase F1 subunit gamma [Elusimicrobiota bacterium]|jgi:F-type H+-transporting ATPase subunit gamma|nr:ATP synthase F1 subunit gamma [Elusimicrobiota bacterium]